MAATLQTLYDGMKETLPHVQAEVLFGFFARHQTESLNQFSVNKDEIIRNYIDDRHRLIAVFHADLENMTRYMALYDIEDNFLVEIDYAISEKAKGLTPEREELEAWSSLHQVPASFIPRLEKV